MKNAQGKVEETFLDGSARIVCPPELTPAPGQYLAAHAGGSDAPLPVVLFPGISSSQSGFRSAPVIPASWRPGQSLYLRGPIGRGFSLPVSSRKLLLAAFEDTPARLLGLISPALKQNAEVVLAVNSAVDDLPEVVEVQPLKGLPEALAWADYAAFDVSRENLNQMRQRLAGQEQVTARLEAQVLVHAPMPCGAIADCGVCALILHHDWKMICKEGPVFLLKDLL
ncbi:MAG: hypothetical protein HXY38_13675 [Chloroflexi bacterium]|nr:hypothetical protein [Chloroflexota bacterium]